MQNVASGSCGRYQPSFWARSVRAWVALCAEFVQVAASAGRIAARPTSGAPIGYRGLAASRAEKSPSAMLMMPGILG